ncbi:hypothetical protein ABW19_dt0201786 [Dactylella cylindrospora]|nr:hypothetical protein ABW19_dt0201786 [Dactylella cylindrospora]
MPLDRLPAEIIVSIVRDYNIIGKPDLLHLILTCRNLYQLLKQFLFSDLSYGYLKDSEEDELLPILELHGFDNLPKQSVRAALKWDPDRSLLFAVQSGWIEQADLKKVRELRLYSDIESLHDDENSILKFLELLQVGYLENVTDVKLYLLRGSGTRNISSQSSKQIEDIFRLLQLIPARRVRLHLVTDTFQCLQLVSESPTLTLDTLFIDATLSNREEIEIWQDGLKQFTGLTHLAYKGMSPWAASAAEIGIHGLCDDFPNLKIIRLICSPNFSALPRSLEEVHIDIGERDQIIHHCFPLITTLPNLKVLYALNRQNTLPRYHGNPMQTTRLPGTAFSTLRRLHAEMPRPDEKLMFFPPGVLETITNCNPNLEHIFLPFLSAYDANNLATSDCTRTLKSIEIQSSICRTITRESSFDVSNLINLFSGPGVPNLEVLKWSCGGKQEMAVSRDLIEVMFPRESQPFRRHNLQLIAVESRLPKPQSPYVFAGILNWAELMDHRQSLRKACVGRGEGEGEDEDLEELVKSVTLTADGVDEDAVEEDLEFPYEHPLRIMVRHHQLTGRESEYLRKWRRSGGSLGMSLDRVNDALVLDFRKSVWEELYFFDLGRMESFLKPPSVSVSEVV